MIVEALLVVGAIALGYKYKSSIEATVKAELAGLESSLTNAISTEVASLKTKL